MTNNLIVGGFLTLLGLSLITDSVNTLIRLNHLNHWFDIVLMILFIIGGLVSLYWGAIYIGRAIWKHLQTKNSGVTSLKQNTPSPSEINSLRIKAENDDHEAQLELSGLYSSGRGVKKDMNESLKWLSKSAELGNDEAQFYYAIEHENGMIVPQNFEQAFYWFNKAAEQGFALACIALATWYEGGIYVPKDLAMAVEYNKKGIDIITTKAEAGDVIEQNNLGGMYKVGQGVQQDYYQANAWFHKAAKQGEYMAMLNLGDAYKHGTGVPKSHKQAIEWYSKAMEHTDYRLRYSITFDEYFEIRKNHYLKKWFNKD